MTTTTCATPIAATKATFSGSAILRAVHLGLTARRQRAVLRKLDSAALEDIGITQAKALEEAARPVWDVPNAWRR